MSGRMGPRDVPQPSPAVVHHEEVDDDAIMEIRTQLAKLREQFPDERIEKLPKPLWKDAWKDLRAGHCTVCNGRHVLQNCIHLDYVGHANVTDRLLEVDPFWEWEPMAFTEQGTPLFTDGGLWIYLTICGVTRIGFGDGKSIKEVIGDAIRNAAMRFGVGLDLWAKVDLHEERNPGDGEPSQRRGVDARASDRGVQNSRQGRAGEAGPGAAAGDSEPPGTEPAPNQDALDSLGEVCDENGYDRRQMAKWYAKWAKDSGLPDQDLLTAESDHILAFAAKLIEVANPEPEEGSDSAVEESGNSDTAGGAGGVGEVSAASAVDAGDVRIDDSDSDRERLAGVACPWCGNEHEGGPENCVIDTSDVEQQPGEAF